MTIKQLILSLVCCLVVIIVAETIIAMTKKLGFVNELGLGFIKVVATVIEFLILLPALEIVSTYLAIKVLHVNYVNVTQSNGMVYVQFNGFSAWLYLLIFLAVTIPVGVSYYFIKKHHHKKLAINKE